MSDQPPDLVRELRAQHKRAGVEDPGYYCDRCAGSYDYESDPDGTLSGWPCLAIRAADEIERLRGERDEWREADEFKTNVNIHAGQEMKRLADALTAALQRAADAEGRLERACWIGWELSQFGKVGNTIEKDHAARVSAAMRPHLASLVSEGLREGEERG